MGTCQPQGRREFLAQPLQYFSQQTFAFSVSWSDDSDTFVRRSWDEFKTLHVSEPGGPRIPGSETHQ